MDLGELIFGGGMLAVAIVGACWDAWRSRRRYPTPVVEVPSHVRTVVPKRGLALDAYTSLATRRDFGPTDGGAA